MNFHGSDIISVNQFDLADVTTLFTLAHRMRGIAKGETKCKLLEGAILGNLFFEASTRSRMSFASAFMRLGGQVNSTTGFAFSSMDKGESLSDAITVIKDYCDALVIRHPQIGAAQEAARYADIPVINAGDGAGEHPTQALLDLFTIFEERKVVNGSTIAFVGDLKFGRTVHSLAKLLTLYQGVNYVCIAPPQVQMPDLLIQEIRSKGFDITLTDDLETGVRSADVVYSTRIQEERFEDKMEFETIKDLCVLNRKIVTEKCKKDVTIMHPLPRTSELSTDLDSMPNAAYFRQSANGVLVRMALFLLLLGRESQLV